MGLNIFVRWGVKFDEDGSCLDFSDTIRQLQNNKINAYEVGNIDHNWSSVKFCCDTAQRLNAPDPILGLYPAWNGCNGENLAITPTELDRLGKFKSSARQWLHDRRNAQPPDSLSMDDWKYFYRKLNEAAIAIDFIEQHKNEPGLRIEFG